jgi:hypothetical protein
MKSYLVIALLCTSQTPSDLTGKSAFTVALGGGVDVRAWRFVWIRVIQADYLRASFPNSEIQNSPRLSFGFTFHLGSLRKNPKD